MSISYSILAIKGDYFSQSKMIFKYLGLEETGREYSFSNWLEMVDSLSQPNLRGLWEENGWTIIVDSELVDGLKEGAISRMANEYETNVVSLLVDDVSQAYRIAMYQRDKQRIFDCIAGVVEMDSGTPLPEEKGLNISELIDLEDVFAFAERLGISIESQGEEFLIKEVRNIGSTSPPPSPKEKARKPWWRFFL